jgi:hypothetical protein
MYQILGQIIIIIIIIIYKTIQRENDTHMLLTYSNNNLYYREWRFITTIHVLDVAINRMYGDCGQVN